MDRQSFPPIRQSVKMTSIQWYSGRIDGVRVMMAVHLCRVHDDITHLIINLLHISCRVESSVRTSLCDGKTSWMLYLKSAKGHKQAEEERMVRIRDWHRNEQLSHQETMHPSGSVDIDDAKEGKQFDRLVQWSCIHLDKVGRMKKESEAGANHVQCKYRNVVCQSLWTNAQWRHGNWWECGSLTLSNAKHTLEVLELYSRYAVATV